MTAAVTGAADGAYLAEIRSRRPLVHMITNLVSMAACAQAVKAVGAATIFAHVAEEAEEIAEGADAVVLNVGTSVPGMQDTVRRVARVCAARGIPVVLDPLGAGASRFRTELARDLLAGPAVRIVSGNAAELAALSGLDAVIRGADSISTAEPPAEISRALAAKTGAVTAVSGATDYLSDGGQTVGVANGHPVMGQVVGTGSARSAVLGAFAAVADGDFLAAAVAGVCAYGIAGEIAAASGAGPGYLLPELYNALAALDDQMLAARARVTDRWTEGPK